MKLFDEDIVQDDQENEDDDESDEPTDSTKPTLKKKCTALSHLLFDIYLPNQQRASQNITKMEAIKSELAFYKGEVCLDIDGGFTAMVESESYTVPFTFTNCKEVHVCVYICSCCKCEVRRNIFHSRQYIHSEMQQTTTRQCK